MPDKEDAGAAYLAALKQSRATAGAAAAPARAPDCFPNLHSGDAGPPGNTNNPNPERRKSPRYQCTGKVRLQPSGGGASTWATFTDISIHGCYIESAVPYQKGAILDLKLDANGFHIDTVGEVRVSYPGLGMGVSFVKMIEADRGRLHDLVSSISPRSVIMGARLPSESVLMSRPDAPPAVTNPGAALQAMQRFFENRHMMGREEFLRILRDSQ